MSNFLSTLKGIKTLHYEIDSMTLFFTVLDISVSLFSLCLKFSRSTHAQHSYGDYWGMRALSSSIPCQLKNRQNAEQNYNNREKGKMTLFHRHLIKIDSSKPY
jgi:hypothetical protein